MLSIYGYFSTRRMFKNGEINQKIIEKFFRVYPSARVRKKSDVKFLHDYLAYVFKKCRKYEVVKEWEKAKDFYNNWKEQPYVDDWTGQWAVVVSSSYPSKGKLFNEYYINDNPIQEEFRIFKVDSVYGEGDNRQLQAESNNHFGNYAIQCRLATKEEANAEEEKLILLKLTSICKILPISQEE